MQEDIDWSTTYDIGDWVYLYPPSEIPEEYWDSPTIHYVDEVTQEDHNKWYEVVKIDQDGDMYLEGYKAAYTVCVDPRWVQSCPEGSMIWVLPRNQIHPPKIDSFVVAMDRFCKKYLTVATEVKIGPLGPGIKNIYFSWLLEWLRPTPFLEPCSKNIPVVKTKGLCPQCHAAGETYSPETVMKAVRDACRGIG